MINFPNDACRSTERNSLDTKSTKHKGKNELDRQSRDTFHWIEKVLLRW